MRSGVHRCEIGLMWVMQAQFAGYALARRELPEVTLVPWTPGRSTLTEVAVRDLDFGVVSPSQLLERPSEAESVVFVALFMDHSPIVLVGLRDRVGTELAGNCRVGV